MWSLGEKWWDESCSTVSFRHHIPLTALCASCSFGPVLDKDSVHAFNDTVDLFTALRGIRTVQTQRPCQNRLPITRVELWELRHRSCAAGLCNTISLDMWDWRGLLCIRWTQYYFYSWKWFMLGISQLKLKTQFGGTCLCGVKAFKSVCLSRLIDVRYENKIQTNTTRVGNVVKAGQVKEMSAGKQHGPPKMLQSVYLMSSVWVPSSTATQKCRKSQRRTQRERKREKRQDPN